MLLSYPWKHLNPKDHFVLRLERTISDQDVHVLTTLYQPLIGSNAFSLYMALKGSIQIVTEWTAEQPISSLLSRLDIGIPEFYQARVRLEALGLLKVYRSKKNNDLYLYEVRPPMSAALFFQDNMMRLILVEKVGERIYKELRSQFISERPSDHEYEDVTKSFLDVFHFDLQKYNRMNRIGQDVLVFDEKNSSPSESITENDGFDWNFFQKGLDRHFINKKSITQEIKELIYTFYTIYGIDELDMQRLLLEASDVSSGNIDKNKFIRIVHRSYHTNQRQAVQMNDKVGQSIDEMQRKAILQRNTLKQKGFSEEEIEIIEHAEQVSPGEYLKSVKQQKGGFVTSNETWVLKELAEQSSLPSSVLNILINYILIIKDEAVFEKSLAIKIANDWAQKGVTSPDEAMEKVKQLYVQSRERKQQRTNRYSGKNPNTVSKGRKETLPKWAEESSVHDEKITAEEEQAFREKLRKIRERKGGAS